jgi:hypothetical protein
MRRRDFIAGLGGAVAWPVAAQARQSGRMWRVGVLMNGPAWSLISPSVLSPQ